MTIIASTDFEAGTAGNSVPTNGSDCFNAGSAVGTGTAKYVAAHAHSGTKSMQLHTAATTDQAFRTVTFTAQAVTAVRGYFTFTSAPSANMDFLSLYSTTTKIGDVRLMATGAITLRNVNTQVAASAALSTNTLYRWEWRVAPDPTTGTQSFRIFSGLSIESTSSWDAQITGAASGSAATSATEVRLHISGGPIADLWVDDYAIADDWVGATSKSIDAAVAITASNGAGLVFNPGVVGASRAATAVATADGTVVHIGAGTIAASTGFQAGTVGANVPTNSTDLFDAGSAVGTGTATYDNQHTHLATTRSMQLDCPAATDQIFRSRTITAAATGAARMYFTLNALPAATTQIWAAYLTNAKVADVRITPAGLLTIRNVNTVVDTAAAALVPGTLYRLEWKVAPNATGGTQSLKIASGTKLDVSSQADETLTGAATGSGATQVDEFRVSLFGAAARAWVDDYAVGSGDYLGASLNGKVIDAASLVTAAAVAAPAGVRVVIDAPGAAVAAVAAAGVTTNPGGVVDWVVKTVKVWNGSAWVVKPVKVWNGTAWVTKTVKVQHFVPVVGTTYNIGGSSRATAHMSATMSKTAGGGSGILAGSSFQGNGVTGWQDMDTSLIDAASYSHVTYAHPPYLMKSRRSYNSSLPTTFANHSAHADIAMGVTSVFSVKAGYGDGTMAAGNHDEAMRVFIQSMPTGWSGYACWQHEPEDGNANNFRPGFARFAKLCKKYAGARNIVPIWIMISSTMRSGGFDTWNPGPDLAANSVPTFTGTNAGTLGPMALNLVAFGQDGYHLANDLSPSQLFNTGFVAARGYGYTRFGITEVATDTSGQFYTLAVSRAWTNTLISYCRGISELEVVCYFNSDIGGNAPTAGWAMFDDTVRASWAEFAKNG